MPPVEIQNRASEREVRPALTEQARFETLANEHDADQLGERTGWAPVDAEQQSKQFHAHDGGSAVAAPARSVAPRDCAAREQSTCNRTQPSE